MFLIVNDLKSFFESHLRVSRGFNEFVVLLIIEEIEWGEFMGGDEAERLHRFLVPEGGDEASVLQITNRHFVLENVQHLEEKRRINCELKKNVFKSNSPDR